jgi:protein phosphatase
MNVAERIATAGTPLVVTTWQQLPIGDANACAKAISWWEEITARSGEGMVVKPSMFIARGSKGLIQPALKVRGREYLRMIYGPEYDAPDNLSRLRERGSRWEARLSLERVCVGPRGPIAVCCP